MRSPMWKIRDMAGNQIGNLPMATELPGHGGRRTGAHGSDMPEKGMGESHFDERWEGTVKSIFGMNLSDYADGEQDTEKLKVMAAPDGLWCDCRRSMDDGELIFYREAMLSPLAEQIKESDYIRYTVRKMESGPAVFGGA